MPITCCCPRHVLEQQLRASVLMTVACPQEADGLVSRLKDGQADLLCIFSVDVLILVSGLKRQSGWWVEVFIGASRKENFLYHMV